MGYDERQAWIAMWTLTLSGIAIATFLAGRITASALSTTQTLKGD